MISSKAEQNNIKATIAASYNKLYCQFSNDELSEVGNYKISKFIGEGSFGKAYLATHKLTHQKVVLKTGNKNDPNVVREVFYHRQFDFPYITKLYEVVVTESKVWMALEYCSGHELYEHLLKEQRFSLEESAKLLAQIASAVYYAHEFKCVHRDLKLENVLLDKNGHAKLTDFGFTREVTAKCQLESICGTTVYMAPELIERKAYDGFKTDIWALGVILYTMVNGFMPFDEDDEERTKWKIINEEPNYHAEWMNDEAIDLIKHTLMKDPNSRISLKDLLCHPFLQPWGSAALEKTEKLIAFQREGKSHFRSKTEKRLLKRLKQCGFDSSSIKNSVYKKKCDSLSGLWFLLLEKDKTSECSQPKRSRSVLSVRKVFESSVNMVMDDILVQPQESTKTSSLKRVTSRKSEKAKITDANNETSFEAPASNVLMPIKLETLNTSAGKKKKTFLQRVSSLLKPKKSNPNSEKENSNRHSLQSIQPLLGKRRHKTNSTGSQKISNERDTLEGKTENNFVQFEDPVKQTENSRLKKKKSLSSNEAIISKNESRVDASNNGASSEDLSKLGLHSSARRSSIVSQHSAISNDTFNSEYSTDAQSGFRSNVTQSSNRTTMASDSVSNIKKNVRRSMSVLSSASSNSEMSSRTDSFYDITTASSPMAMDIRANYNMRPESHFPKMGGNSFWSIKRGRSPIGRHNRINNRSLNRNFRQINTRRAQSVIQEESSFDENDRGDNLDGINEYDSAEIVIQSDGETGGTLSKETTPIYPIGLHSSDIRPVIFTVGRSMSEGSNWSRPTSELLDGNGELMMKVNSAHSQGNDDSEFGGVADDEDNSLDYEDQDYTSATIA